MKKLITISLVAALALLLLSSCSGNKGEVAQGSMPLPTVPAPAIPAPTASAPTTAPQPSPVETVSVGNQVGNLAPDFQLKNLDGKSVSLSDFKGKPIWLNFWATW